MQAAALRIQDLFVPPDLAEAHEEWKANCGPGAIAALVCIPLSELRWRFEGWWPGYTNIRHAKRVLIGLGWSAENIKEPAARGLGFVQFSGPWEEAGPRAAYKHTHWIAYRRLSILGAAEGLAFYDVNADAGSGGWMSQSAWQTCVFPGIAPERCTGWWMRSWIEAAPGAAPQPKGMVSL